MSDVLTWISSTAFPALGSCWDFFKKCVVDLISYVTSSRLVFIFALFLIGTIISVIVFIVTSTPNVSDVDSSYPEFKSIKQHDLYYSGFKKPVTMLSRIYFKRKSDKIFEKSNIPYVTVGGYKFYNPNYKKFKSMKRGNNRSQNSSGGNSSENSSDSQNTSSSSKKNSPNLDIEVD